MCRLLKDLVEEPFTPAQWLAPSLAGRLVFGAGWLALVCLLTAHMSGDAGLLGTALLLAAGVVLLLWLLVLADSLDWGSGPRNDSFI